MSLIKKPKKNRPPILEALEPRILFSADAFGAALDNYATDDPLADALDQARQEYDALLAESKLANAQQKALEHASQSDAQDALAPADEQNEATRELVFVDTDTPDYQQLVDDLTGSADSSRQFHVILLDNSADGIAQITDALAQYTELDAVHIISHGADGSIDLGNTQLNEQTLIASSDAIGQWSNAFSVNGDLLIYGCELAATSDGELLVNRLAAMTGADVAASDDLTGSAALGGDWDLEYFSGVIETSASLSIEMQQSWAGLLANPDGGEIDINTTTANAQTTTKGFASAESVAMDANGNSIVVWQSDLQDGSLTGVYATRFDANGNALDVPGSPGITEFLVNTTTTDNQREPTVAMDDAGNYVIVWTGNGTGDSEGIFFRRYDAAGNALDATEQLINTTLTGAQRNPAVAMDADGDFVVAWAGEGTGDTDGIFYRRFDAAGVAQDVAEVRVNTVTDQVQQLPAVAMDDVGNFVVSWDSDDDASNSDDYNIHFQQYTAGGSTIGINTQVNTNATTMPELQQNSSIAIDGAGNFTITWESDDDTSNSDDFNIHFKQYNSSGGVLIAETLVNTNTAEDQTYSSVAAADDGRFTITWTSDDDASNSVENNIYVQEYTSAGVKFGTETLVNTTTALDQQASSVAMSSTGEYLVAWNGNGTGDADGIFGQLFMSAGTLVVDTNIDYNNADGRYGDTSSITALLGDKGTDGLISLREAIDATNNTGGDDTIYFNIAGTGVHTIALVEDLEFITDTVTIDATTESDYGSTPLIELDGNGISGSTAAFRIVSDNTTIKGFSIYGFGDEGIEIFQDLTYGATSGSNNTLEDNWIGLKADGTTADGVTGHGILIADLAANNTVRNNIVVDSGESGIQLGLTGGSGSTDGNKIQGNIIGLKSDGTSLAGNSIGISVVGGSTNNIIGTDGDTVNDANEGNVVSASTGSGIYLNGSSSTTVSGNYIGTDVGGTLQKGNGSYGIEINNSDTNTIGGSTADQRNVIVDNNNSGISIWNSSTFNNLVQGNYIGVDATGIASLGNYSDGIVIGGGAYNNTIGGDRTAGEGNVISGNIGASTDGIEIYGAGTTGNKVYGNYIGTNFDGTAPLGNGRYGVVLYDGAQNTEIGGVGTGEGNIIAGNTNYGVIIDGANLTNTHSNLIQANTIGLGSDGATIIANAGGVLINQGAYNNTIGGSNAAAKNIISGNNGAGIYMSGSGTDGNTIQGNFIGTDSGGTLDKGNTANNIDINTGASNNIIGGSGANEGNTVAFSDGDGITIWSGSTTGNTVQGNYIGTDSDGLLDLGNAMNGVIISGGSSDNLVGGTDTGEGNLIFHNNTNGIEIRDNGTLDNSVIGNRIYDNTSNGIDLVGEGVTNNDLNDADSGNSNDRQNFPVITLADLTAGNLTVSGTLDTNLASTDYHIEFFGNAAGEQDATHGEGRIFLGSTTLTTNGSGDGVFSNVLLTSVTLTPGDFVSATATVVENTGQVGVNDLLAYGSTSEFAANFVIANDAPTLDNSAAILWTSTIADMTGSTANGLANWTDGDLLQFAAPDLGFGENATNGNFSTTGFNLDNFAGDADIDALHHVGQDVLVGSGANAIQLRAGDILFSTESGENLVSTNSLSVASKDLVLFRADNPGDYSAGTFTIVLDNPLGGEIKGATLVEQNIIVGDANLTAGSFILSKGDKKLYLYSPDTVGETTTTGPTETTLIDGPDLGIDENINGVHLVQQTITTGGVTLQAGQLLVSLNNEDSTVGTGPADTERRDVIALSITQTGDTTIGDGAIFFDGDDVNLTDNNEDLDAITLVAQARLNPIFEDISGPANTGTLVADLIDAIASDANGDPVGIAITAADEAFGIWEYSIDGGSNWQAVGSVTDNLALVLTNTASDLVRFVPNADSAGSATISFRAWDSTDLNTSGTPNVNTIPNGGTSAFSTATVDATIQVRSVNDPLALNANATDSTPENTPLVFNTSNANLISITDIDVGAGELEVTLTAATGTVTLGGTIGLTFSVGDGTADTSMTFRGSLADLNTALDGLAYTPVTGYAGDSVLNLSVEELGSSDLGDNFSDLQSIDITIAPDATNDAPINTVPGTQFTNEDTPFVLSEANGNGISIVDDSGANPIEVTLSADNGILTLDNHIGPEFTINTTVADTQKDVQILTTATGTGIAVWNSKSLDGSGEGIFGQIYDSNGLPLGGEFQVNTFFADHQSEPDIAAAADGSFVVVWQSKNQDTDGQGIYAQRFDPAGNAVGIEFRVNSFTAEDQQLPAVAMNASGDFVVTWQSKNQDGDGEGIYAQRYDSAGNTVGGELLVNAITANNQKNPDVAMDTAGNFVVVWDSKGQDADKEAIIGRRFEVGTGFGAEFQINSYEASDQKNAVIAMQSTGEFVVAWESNGQDGGGKGIYAQLFDNSTIPVAVGSEIPVNTNTANNQQAPTISMNSSGEFLIAWQSKGQDDPDGKEGVYAQLFLANGTAQGAEFQLNTVTPGNQRDASVSLLDDGSMWTAWDNKEIFSQRFQSHNIFTFTAGTGANDASMTFSGTQADINEALDGLVYTPNVDFDGADTVTITTNDNGHTGGGSLTDIDSFIINVAAANDAPVVTVPALQNTSEEIPVVFSTGNGNLVSISDIDADAGLVELTLTATNGSMSLNGIAGLTFSVGDGTADTEMTLQGSVADINAALDGLSFTSPTDYVGLGLIRLTVDDLGNTGIGGSLVDSAAVYINITADAVNDAPTIQPPADFALPIDTGVTFDGANLISILDDADQNSIELTLTVTNGTVTFNEQIDTEHLVNTEIADAQLGAVVAAAPNGSYVIVWQSKNQDGNGEGIFAQVYDAFGNAQGSEVQVNTEFSGNQITPAVAMDSLGNFVVAWESNGNLDGDGRGIFVQMFSADGQKVDIEFQGNTTATDDQTLPAIGMDDLGNFVLVWQSKNQDGNGEGIFAQRFDSNGYALDDEFQVNSTFANNQIDPAVAVDANGDFVIVWTSTNQDVDGDGIFAQRYDANGIAQGIEFQVNFDGVKHQRAPAVAIDALGNFVVAWQSENQDTDGYGIYARRFDAAGNALDPADVLVNTYIAKHQIAPSISMNAVGEYIIAWQSQDQDTDGEGTYGQWFNASGTAIGGEVRLNTTVTNDQTAPSVAITGSGDYIAAWTSKNQDTDAEGIYARQVASPGGLNFTTGDGVDDNSIVVTGRPDRINAALNGMTFTPTPGFNGLATIQIDVDDLGSTGTGGPYTDTHTINLVYNTAPTLNNSGTPSLTAINEDDISNTGDLVSSIIASGAGGNPIDDVDAGASEGIAVVAVDNTNGTWEYSINGGGLWAAIGAVTNSSAVLLGDGANDRIRFVPNANYNGAAGNITFRAWDATDGNASGTTGIDVSVNGGNTSYSAATETAGITVNSLNDDPTVDNIIPDQGATEDTAFNFTFNANTFGDVDTGDTLTYSATLSGGGALPGWLTFNAGTRTFSGTPLAADVGTISIEVTADDSQGGTPATDTFDIVIASNNTDPTLDNAIADQSATEDTAFNFTFNANTFGDVDAGDTLTYSATLSGGGALPSWLTFNAGTRTFSGTPLNADVGTISVEVTADDGNGGTPATDTFDIVISNSNDDPTLDNAIPNQAATEDSAFSFTFNANTFGDVDAGDTLTYSATLSGGAPLPSWLTFTAATRTFSGTPLNADVGTISVEVTADDSNGGTPATDTFDIVVANSNDDPTVDNIIPNQAATEDTAFSFAFNANTFGDVDSGDTLTYSATLSGGAPLPSWLTFTAATRTFSGTPLNADVGTISVEVTADDGNGGTPATDTFDIVIANSNDDPTLDNAIPNQAATEDTAFSFAFNANTFGDVDAGDTLTYSATLSGGGALPSWLTFNAGTRTFSGTPLNADVGTISVEVTADDSNGGTPATDTFDIVIANSNDDPTVDNIIPNQAATEDTAFSFAFNANTFGDVDSGDTLTYSATLSGGAPLPSWLTFTAATRTFSGTPLNADVGTISIEVTADDSQGGTPATDTFDIVIANSNDDPTVDNIIPDQAATEDTAFSFAFNANTFGDVDTSDTLTYSATLSGGAPLPSWLTFTAATRTFSGTPLNADVGTISVEVTADDSNGGTPATDTFDIVISNSNDDPTLDNAIPDQAATEDTAFSFAFNANTFGDVDTGDTLTYSATLSGGGALPSWLTFNAATRTFSGTPLNADVGTISVEVTADDSNGGTPATDTFDIVIANSNDDPTLDNAIADQAATEDTAFSFAFNANTFGDVDAGDTLTYSATLSGGGALPSWLTFNAGTRTFSGTPLNADVGTISVEVTADDGNGGTPATDTFDIVISNSNDDPTLDNAIPDQAATEDTAFSFAFNANTFGDVDAGDTLTYSATLPGGGALPSWLTFNAGTRTFSGTPLNADVGTISVEVTADDSNGGTPATDTFDIVIANSNDDPTLDNAIADQAATEDTAFSFTFNANTFGDVDSGDTLTYSATLSGGGALPGWLTFNAATRTFSGTPLNADVGTISVEVTADDGNGGTPATDTFDIVIANTNDDPTVDNPIPDQNTDEDSLYNYTFNANTFGDVDASDTLTYTAQLSGGAALPSWLAFDGNTRSFVGIPLNADVGFIDIEVIADDGTSTVSDVFRLTIDSVNDAPVNTVPGTQTVVEETATAIPGISIADVDAGVANLTTRLQVSGGTLNISLAGSASIASGSNNSGDLTILGTVADINATLATLMYTGGLDLAGIAADTLTVTTNDGGNTGSGGALQDSDVVQIDITNVNDDPTVDNPIPDQAAMEDTAFNFTFNANTFGDVDSGDTLTYSATLSGGAPLPAWLSFDSATRTFSGTPLNADVGTLSVEVTADDGNGGTPATDTFDIVVANTNNAPTFGGTNTGAVTEDVDPDTDGLLEVNNIVTVSDPDAGESSFVADTINGTYGDLVIDAAGNWSYAADNTQAAIQQLDVTESITDTLTVTTFDGTTHDIVITINGAEDAPVQGGATTGTVAEDGTLVDNGTLTITDTDSNDNPVSYNDQTSIAGSNGYGNFVMSGNTWTYTLNNSHADVQALDVTESLSDTFTFTATDGSSTQLVTVTINGAEDAPTVDNAIADQSATEDAPFSFTFNANSFGDVDTSDTLTYTAQLNGGGALPGWLTFNAGTRTFSGTPLNADVGTINIDVIADDGSTTIADTFTLTVNNTDDAPVIGGVDTGAVTEDIDPDSDTLLEVNDALTIADPDAGESSFVAATINGTYGDLVIDTAGNWSYSADNTQAAIQQLDVTEFITDTLTVTTADGTTHDIVITINGAEDAPVLGGTNTGTVAEDGTLIASDTLTITDTDTNDNPISYNDQTSIAGSNGYGNFAMSGNIWTYTLNNSHADVQALDVTESLSDTFTFTATDGSSTQTVTVTINGAEDAPTVDNAIADQSATEDAPFSFTFNANSFGDVDTSDTLTYTAQLNGGGALPSWLTFNAATRTFSGTPLNADVGTISIDVIADDGSTTIADTFTLTVNNTDDAPVIGGVDTGAVTEDVDPDTDGLLEVNNALTIADPDVGESSFVAETIVGTYGDLVIDTAGNWSYSADNTQAAIQSLDVTESITDTLTVTTADGTTHNIVITINGAEDAPVLGGTNTGTVAEDGTLIASDTLTITDADANDNPISYNDQASIAGNNGYGNFEMSGNAWTYTLANGSNAVQSLDAGQSVTDTFTFTASDGSTRTVTVTINGAEDAPVIGGTNTGTVAEDGTLVASNTLTITDADASDNPISYNDQASIAGNNGYGNFEIASNTWTYTLGNGSTAVQSLDAGQTVNDSFTFTASDSSTQTVTVTINGAEDAPTASDNTIRINQNSFHIFSATDFGFSDIDGDTMSSVRIIALETAGDLKLAGGDVNLNDSISRADIDAGLLSWQPTGAESGNNYANIGFSVSDGAIDSASQSIRFDVDTIVIPDPDQDDPDEEPTEEYTPPENTTPPSDPQPEDETAEPSEVPIDELVDAPQEDVAFSAGKIDDGEFIQPLSAESIEEITRGDNNDKQDLSRESIALKQFDLANLQLADYSIEALEILQRISFLDNDSFVEALDDLGQELERASSQDNAEYALGAETRLGLAVSLSAGFVSWALRAGSLMASFFSIMPLWKQLDPLPIIGSTQDPATDPAADNLLDELEDTSTDADASNEGHDHVEEIFKTPKKDAP